MAIPSSSSEEKTKVLPPDDELQNLARLINTKLKSGRIDFFCEQPPDGPMRYAIIFQSGSKRATVKLRNRPTEQDTDDIMSGMEGWVGSPRAGPLYTTEVPEF